MSGRQAWHPAGLLVTRNTPAVDAGSKKYTDYAHSSGYGNVGKKSNPLAALNARLRKAGLDAHVVAVAAQIDPSSERPDDYRLTALTYLTESQQEQLVDLIRPASFTLDMRRLTQPPQ
jgi:hypothetical protein